MMSPWVRALLASLASGAAFVACANDFDTFEGSAPEPRTETPDAAQLVDAGGSSSGDPKDSSAPADDAGPLDAGADGSRCPKAAACLSAKTSCSDVCTQTYDACIDACGSNNKCKKDCRDDRDDCRTDCSKTCAGCVGDDPVCKFQCF
jgi:hypothetical protein